MALRSRFVRDQQRVGLPTTTLLILQTAVLAALVGTALAAVLYIATGVPPLGVGSALRAGQDFFLMHWPEGAVAGTAAGAARHLFGMPGFVAGFAGLLLMTLWTTVPVLFGPVDPVLALQGMNSLLLAYALGAMFPTVWLGRRLLIL